MSVSIPKTPKSPSVPASAIPADWPAPHPVVNLIGKQGHIHLLESSGAGYDIIKGEVIALMQYGIMVRGRLEAAKDTSEYFIPWSSFLFFKVQE